MRCIGPSCGRATAWRQVLESDPTRTDAADALCVLYEANEQWSELVHLLETRGTAMERLRAADICRLQLGASERSTEVLRWLWRTFLKTQRFRMHSRLRIVTLKNGLLVDVLAHQWAGQTGAEGAASRRKRLTYSSITSRPRGR